MNSEIFDDLSDSEKQKYIAPIVKRLFSDEFLTDAGIRCRSIEYVDKLNFADYHGSLVSWPFDTYATANGLRRQGFPELAVELENRIVNTVNFAGVHYEFFFVDRDGHVVVDYESKKTGQDGRYDLQMAPEHDQGWTISAIMDIKRNRAKRHKLNTQDKMWQTDIENSILLNIKRVPAQKFISEIEESRPDKQDVKFNTKRGLGKTVILIIKELFRQNIKN